MSKTLLHLPVCCFLIFFFLTINNGMVSASCPTGTYGVISSNGILNCKNCSTLPKCPHDMGISTFVQCGSIIHEDSQSHCVNCIFGKNFSLTFDHSMCQPCQSTTCQPNEMVDGECTTSSDSTRCTGKCGKGFYSKTGSVEDCEPCAECHGPKAKRVPKCIADNEASGFQCEPHTGLPSKPINATIQAEVITEGQGKKDERLKSSNYYVTINKGFTAFGHPALSGSLLVIITVLFACLYIMWKTKRDKINQLMTLQSQQICLDQLEKSEDNAKDAVIEVANEMQNTLNGETALQVTPSKSIRSRKKNSVSSDERAGSTRKNSNSVSEMDVESKALIGKLASDEPLEEADDVFVEQTAATFSSPPGPVRKRSHSSSSGRKDSRPRLGRQNSNPGAENPTEKSMLEVGMHRRSKTFGSFSSIVSISKVTTEEKKPFLSALDENENPDDVLMMKIKPQEDFQGHTTTPLKPSELNATTYLLVCSKLNQDSVGKDWQKLAGLMGYNIDNVKMYFKGKGNPADALLTHWETSSGNDVKKLIGHLEEMGRSDIIELLQ